jgi:hypothetical protein
MMVTLSSDRHYQFRCCTGIDAVIGGIYAIDDYDVGSKWIHLVCILRILCSYIGLASPLTSVGDYLPTISPRFAGKHELFLQGAFDF